jgi:hypothetical protein
MNGVIVFTLLPGTLFDTLNTNQSVYGSALDTLPSAGVNQICFIF